MSRGYKGKTGVVALAVVLMLATACGEGGQQVSQQSGQQDSQQSGQQTGQDRVDTGFRVTTPESYDSMDTAILVKKDKKEAKITFLNLNRGRTYTLSFDGTTHLYDKYGESVSLEQIAVGDVVDVQMPEARTFKASMLAYALPLLAMLCGLIAGYLLRLSDGWMLLLSLIGLVLGYLAARAVDLRLRATPQWRPSVVNIRAAEKKEP